MSFGQNWISVDNSQLPTGDYNACAVSESGQYQLVTKNAGGIYYSSNYGQTWAQTQSDKSFVSMAVSASGQYAVTNAIKGSNLIYKSDNYGQTWTSTQIVAPVTQSYPIIYPNTGANAKMIIGDGDGYPWGWGGGQYDYAPNLQAAIAYVKSVSPNAVCAVWSGSPTSGGGRINWYNTFTAAGRGTLQLVNGESWVAIQFADGLPGAPSITVDTTTPLTACTKISASGQYITSIIGSGNIYVSANYGSSWTVIDLNKDWLSVAMSASGQYQIASTLNDIYYSSNYGQSWTKGQSVPGQNLKLCMSESGQYACVTTYSGAGVYYSSDYGHTWSTSSGITNAYAIAMSASGKNVIAGAINQNPNSIYYSTNYGASWNLVSSTLVNGAAKINGLSMSYNGQYLLAVTEGEANGNFSTASSIKFVSMSGNAQTQLAVSQVSTISSLYYTSTLGQTWSTLSGASGLPSATATNYSAGAVSGDGQVVAVAANGGYLYTSNNAGASFTNTNPNTPFIYLPFETAPVNGAIGGTTLTVTGSPTLVTGIVGSNAVYFNNVINGSNGTQYIRGTISLMPSFTISFLFNLQTFVSPHYQILFSMYNTGVQIYINNVTQQIGMVVPSGSGTGMIISPFTSIALNTWYNVTLTFQTDGSYYFYLNNSLITSGAAVGTGTFTSTNFSLGTYDNSIGTPFNGYIDDLKIYNSAITFTPMVPANWNNVAVSNSGTYMLATAINGGLFMSSNSGSTWSQVTSELLQANWSSLAISATGQYMLAYSAPVVVQLQMTGLTGAATVSYNVNGVNLTVSASSNNGTSQSPLKAFNNTNGDAWLSDNTTQRYSLYGVVNSNAATTSVIDVGTVAGEYLQVQSSVPIVMYSFALGIGLNAWPMTNVPKTYYIIGSNDGVNWYTLQTGTTNFSAWTGASNYIIINQSGVQTLSGTTSGNITTVAGAYATNPYTYFRLIGTSLLNNGGATYMEIGEWYVRFNGGGQAYSTNFGSTWQNGYALATPSALSLSGSGQYAIGANAIVPQLTGLTANTWTVNGVNWTASASTTLSASFNVYNVFNNKYGSLTNYAWANSIQNYTNTTNTAASSTTIIGVTQSPSTGDWIQIQSSVPVVLYSYQLGMAGQPSQMPQTFYIVGSTDEVNWYPIQYASVAALPNTPSQTLIPSIIFVNTTSTQPFGSSTLTGITYATTTNAYTYFRLISRTVFSASVAYLEIGQWVMNFIGPQYTIVNNYLSGFGTGTATTGAVTGTITASAISTTGQYMALVTTNTSGANVYYSTNYGANFTGLTIGSTPMTTCAISADGSYMTVSNGTMVYQLNNSNGQYLLTVSEGGSNVLPISPKIYTTKDVTISKTGIIVDYIDNTGSAATQTMSFANKTLSINNGLNITSGDTNLSGALVVASESNLQSAVQIDSTLSVASNSALGGTLTVVGAVNMNNTLNVSGASALNSLGVSGGLTSNTVDVSGTSRLRNTLQVDGAATVNSLTVVGASALNSTLAVAGNSALGGTLNVTGASNLASSLVVAGASSLGGSLGVTGATTLGNSLVVAGETTMNGVTTINNNVVVNAPLTVAGAAQMNSSLGVTGVATMNNDANIGRNLNVSGTAIVTGTTALVGATTVTGAASFGSTLSVAGNSTLDGTLNVVGNSALNGTLAVGGTIAVTGTSNLNGAMNVQGASRLYNVVQVDGAATLGNALTVAGVTTMNNGATINGTSALNGAVTVAGSAVLNSSLGVTGAATLNSTLAVTGATTLSNVTVSGDESVAGSLTVVSATALQNTLDVQGTSHLHSSAQVDGAVTLGSSLTVAGATTMNGATVNGTVTVTGSTELQSSLDVTGAAIIESTLAVTGATTLAGPSQINNSLGVTGATTLGSVTVSGASQMNSTLGVNGAATLGGTMTVAGATQVNNILGVTGATTLGNSLAVTGATTINGVTTINNNVVVNGGTNYSAGGNIYGNYIQVQLSSATSIDSYTIGISSESAGFLRNPTLYALVGSNDETTWFSIDNPSSNVDYIVNGSQKSCTRSVSGNYSYYRFIIRSLADTQYWYFFMNYFGLSYNGTPLFNAANPLTGINGNVITNGSLVGTVSYSWYGSQNFDNNTPSNLGRILGNPAADYNVFVIWWGVSTDPQLAYLQSLYPGGTAGSNALATSYTSVTQGSGTFTVNSNSAINAPLTVAGAAQMNSSLGVTGVATINNDANVGRNLNVSGAAIISGTTALVGATTVTGVASLGSNLSVAGNSTLGGTLNVAGNSAVGGTIAVTGTSNLNGAMNVQGASTLGSTLTVAGASQLNNSLAVSGAASLNSTLAVQGNSTFQNNVTVHGNLTVLGGQTSVNTVSMEVKDNAILIADNNTADVLESGLQIQYQPVGASAPLYAGIKRIPVTGQFALFTGATSKISETEPSTGTDIYAGIIADSFACTSDMNLKKNIVNLDGALDKIDNIRGVYHEWIDENQSKDRQIGVIAQEIEAIYPELVTKGENGYLSVNYPKLTAVLIQAVKELKAIVCGSYSQTESKK